MRWVLRLGELPDLTLRQLEYLVAVADAPTWAAAATRVGVSPSALSQGLAELERRVGVPLFRSAGRRRLLRDEAAPVLDHARQVVALTGDLVAWSHRVQASQEGAVRIGMIDVAATVHFVEAIKRFRLLHAQVDVALRVEPSVALLTSLRDGTLDLAVCVEPPDALPGIEVRPVLDEQMVVLAPLGSRFDDPRTWGPWVLFPVGSHTRRLIDAALRGRGAGAALAAESHSPEVLLKMVELGLGWTVLPAHLAGANVAIGPELVRRRLVVARRRGAVAAPAVDAFVAQLDQVVGQMVASRATM